MTDAKVTLFEWEVTPEEQELFPRFPVGTSVKVLYQGGECGESNWARITMHVPNGFLVEPEPCLFYEVPEIMLVKYENVKDYFVPGYHQVA